MLNLDNINLNEVVSVIKDAFLNQDQFSMYRDIHEHFGNENNFVGDDHVFSIFNKKANEFYFVISPYDIISKKAPQHALVFKNGELATSLDFTGLADLRTGVLDTLLLQSLNIKNIGSKKILYFGTGSITQWSIKVLKASYPELKKVYCINRSNGLNEDLINLSNKLDIEIKITSKDNLGDFDYIFCHTNADKPVIDQSDANKLKANVVVASYLTSYDFEEIDDSYWNTSQSNVIVSWDKEVQNSKDLQRAVKSEKIEPSKLITLKAILEGKEAIDGNQRIFFRSAGTPIQNAGILSYILKNKSDLSL